MTIVQARMGSTRLPGKVLADLGGVSMLGRVVRRARRARRVGSVLVATTLGPADDPVVAECRRLDVDVFRGDQDDVLDRFQRAADAWRADVVVRLTADCPLIDPDLIDDVVGVFLDERPDYASNTLERTFPRGLDTEVVSAAALRAAWTEAREPFQRAHVTPFFYQHPERFRLRSVTGPGRHGERRWTVDTPADLALVRELFARLGPGDNFGWRDVLAVVEREPQLEAMNRLVDQKRVEEC